MIDDASTGPMLDDTARDAPDIGSTLALYRHGPKDPTIWLERTSNGRCGECVRATFTPNGPATVQITWSHGAVDADAWGPGADWLLERVPGLVGERDTPAPHLAHADHPVVARCCHAHRHVRIGRSDTLYHELLPTILEQRITAAEAVNQWATLCHELSEPAPGPFARLLLPPAPDVLRRQPTWWFHPLGIELKRAKTLIEVARHPDKLFAWTELEPAEATRRMQLISGVGVWTTGVVGLPGLGDPDAVAVGDYHVKNIIAWNLAGEPRATDERMLELLEPYMGQRGRVATAVMSRGDGPPKFGPKQRILPMSRW